MDSEIKEEIPVHEEFILCCGVETQVLKCGPWTDLINNQSGTRPKLLIFIIPGKFKNLDDCIQIHVSISDFKENLINIKILVEGNRITQTIDNNHP